MTEKLHPTSSTHPSHRWFHSDDGEWRCACGVLPSERQACCEIHALAIEDELDGKSWRGRQFYESDVRWGNLMLIGTESEIYKCAERRTEKERCEWAGVPYLESDYQHIPVDSSLSGHALHLHASRVFGIAQSESENVYSEWFHVRRSAEVWFSTDNAIRGMENVMGRKYVDDMIEMYHQTGGIVRHGCEERR